MPNPATVLMLVTAALSACSQPLATAPDNVQAALESSGPAETGLCSSIKIASTGGDAAMQGVLASDPVGNEYGGGVIRQMVSQGKFKFDGSEMLQGHCWAYARAQGKLYSQDIDLRWRCPVTIVSDNSSRRGEVLLEAVDSERCDFNVHKGDPTERDVTIPLEHISLNG